MALALAGDALACTCAPVDLERDLPRADGAIIGTVLERHGRGDEVVYLFRVEQVYKGDIDNRVEIVTNAQTATCGLDLAVGTRIGLLLERQAGEWRSGLCSEVDAADFLALTDVEDNTLPPFNVGGIVVGFLILAAGVYVLLRKRRSYNRLR